MTTRPFSVDRNTPPAQRDNRNREANRSRAAVPPRQVPAESPDVSGGGHRRGAAVPPAGPVGTAGRDDAGATIDGGRTSVAGGAAVTESTEAEAPISYTVAVDRPSSGRRGLVAGIALGAGVIAVALWALTRRLVK
jgi:hypothetical protein